MLSLKYLLLLCIWQLVAASALEDSMDADEEMRKARTLAKPRLLRNIEIGGMTLPITWASVVALFVLVVNIFHCFVSTSMWCEASHILIKDTSPKTKKAMEAMVTDIGKNGRKFGELATKYSQCPSKTNNGDLGRFSQGDMAPPFDRACFDPKTPLNTTIGPIETQFGYHLIYIRKRKM